jgi:hypothetical protein
MEPSNLSHEKIDLELSATTADLPDQFKKFKIKTLLN